MKLYKALRLRENLFREISRTKRLIKQNNVYFQDPNSSIEDRIDVNALHTHLMEVINEYVGLSYAINAAIAEIASNLYVLKEYQSLISFWDSVGAAEQLISKKPAESKFLAVQIPESKRLKIVEDLQKRVDAIVSDIDDFHHTTEIAWDSYEEED